MEDKHRGSDEISKHSWTTTFNSPALNMHDLWLSDKSTISEKLTTKGQKFSQNVYFDKILTHTTAICLSLNLSVGRPDEASSTVSGY